MKGCYPPAWVVCKFTTIAVQIFSGATLRELDASAYEEAPPLSPQEMAEELGRSSESGAPLGSSSRSLGGRRRSLGRHACLCSCGVLLMSDCPR